MQLDLSQPNELTKAKDHFNFLVKNKKTIELKGLSDSRTSLQNRSLHKFFVMISFALNELGMEFQYFGVKGQQLSCRYNESIVKNNFWRPIQKTLFEIESTKDLNTHQLNEIIDVIVKFFGEKGVFIEFPNKEALNKTN